MLGAEWYVGYMLFGMLVIYPFIRTMREYYIKYIASTLVIVLYGYFSVNYHTVMGSNSKIQTFAGLLLEISTYAVSREMTSWIGRIHITPIKWIIRIYPLAMICAFLAYINSELDTSVQPLLVRLFVFALSIVFCKEGLLSHTGIFDHKIVYWLGKMNLTIYMIQNITRILVIHLMKGKSIPMMYVAELLTTIICGMLAYYIIDNTKKCKTFKN